MTGRTVFPALALALVASLSACTTTVDGAARPEPAAATPTGPPVCERSSDPGTCTEWQHVDPARGQDLFETWSSDEQKSSQMLCSALADDQWRQWLGEGFYRYVSDGTWCWLWSQDNQVAVKLGLFGASPLSEYSSTFRRDPGLAKNIKDIRVGGVPAITSNLTADEDGKGEDRDQVILSPQGDATRPGVLLVTLELHPPRGKPRDTPVDRTRLGFREPLAQALLGALFPH